MSSHLFFWILKYWSVTSVNHVRITPREDLQEIHGLLYIMHHSKAKTMYIGRKITAAVLGAESVSVVNVYNTTQIT